MRVPGIVVLAALLTLVSVAATSYTLYPGESALFEGNNFTASLFTDSEADVASTVSAYNQVKSSTNQTAIDNALDEVRDALERAKADDRLYVSTPWKSLLVGYDTCSVVEGYSVCFNSITYAEEDGPPLGDGSFSAVRYENGKEIRPFVMSITRAAVSLTAKRSFSDSTVYVGELVTVTVAVTNDGDLASERVDVDDFSPLPLYSDGASTELHVGSIPVDDTETLTYTVVADRAGTFVFKAAESSVLLADTTLTVLSPLSMNTTLPTQVFVGDEVPFMVNITNSFDDEVAISSVFLASEDAFLGALTSPGALTVKGDDRLVKSFSIDEGKFATISGTLKAGAAGSHALTIDVSYNANGQESFTVEYPYAVLSRDLAANVSFVGNTVFLTLTNNALEQIPSVTVLFDDGHVEERSAIRPGKSVSVSHALSSAQARETIITVQYDLDGERKIVLSGSIAAGEQQPIETEEPTAPPEQPAQPTPTEPTTPTVVPPASGTITEPTQEEGKGIIKRFLDWLDSIF